MTLRCKLALGAGALALLISLAVWIVSSHIAVDALEKQTQGLMQLTSGQVTEIYPPSLLRSQQPRVAITISGDGLASATADLKVTLGILAGLCGLSLWAGFNLLIHQLIHKRFSCLSRLCRQLLNKTRNSQEYEPAETGDEIHQLTHVLTLAKHKLSEQQENMENLLAELTSLNEELLQADRLKNEFVANMSHEIRTPMNGILGFAELLSQENLTDSQQEYIQTILKCGTNLLTLINDVLDLARIDAGHIQLRKQPCSIRKLLSDNCRLLQRQAEEKGLKLTWQVASDVPDQLLLDPARFRQIQVNLINNAIRYTDRGFVNVKIDTGFRAYMRCLRMSVADSGVGIPPEMGQLIFKPFSQVDGTDRRAYDGAGLGLAICHKLIQAFQGEITFHSIPSVGTEFLVHLPLAEPPEQTDQIDRTQTIQPPEADRQNPKTAPCVLVVDDDQICSQFFKTHLVNNGYQVLLVTDPDQAVSRAEQDKPDAVILDVRRPGKNALDILAELKNKPSTQDIPVIVCSVLQDQDKALNLGALEELRKPFNGDELLKVVRRAVRQSNPPKILAVDDNPTVSRLYEVALQRAGLKVITASSGREALELLAAHPQVGLVILDLVMPGMSGFEVLEHIRSSGRTDLPIIIVTARSMTPQEYKRLDGNVEAILHKAELSPQQLLEQIQIQLGQAISQQPPAQQPNCQDHRRIPAVIQQLESAIGLDRNPEDYSSDLQTILIAEDVVYNRRLLEVLLSRAGYKTISCSDGAQAVGLARQNLFGLIILDMRMPRIDGLEAARLIRNIPHHLSTPIISLTAQTGENEIQHCLQAGCTDYLSKPLQERDLLETVGKYLPAPRWSDQTEQGDSSDIPQSLKDAPLKSQLANDAELMKAVAGYVRELPRLLNEMIQCLHRGAFDELADLGHNLKGSSGLAGYPDLAAKATQLQQNAASEKTEELTAIIPDIARLCRLVGAETDSVDLDTLTNQAAPADSNENAQPDVQNAPRKSYLNVSSNRTSDSPNHQERRSNVQRQPKN